MKIKVQKSSPDFWGFDDRTPIIELEVKNPKRSDFGYSKKVGCFEISTPEAYEALKANMLYDVIGIMEDPTQSKFRGLLPIEEMELGSWTTDYGGFGSYIRYGDKSAPLQEIGFLAHQVLIGEWGGYFYKLNGWEKKLAIQWLKKALQKYKGKELVIGEGAYCGRPLNMKRGIENKKTLQIKKWQDFASLAKIGLVCQEVR